MITLGAILYFAIAFRVVFRYMDSEIHYGWTGPDVVWLLLGVLLFPVVLVFLSFEGIAKLINLARKQ